MILVDTSVWIDHLRSSDAGLAGLLEKRSVLMHPMVFGEIAVGSYRNRDGILFELGRLPFATVATDKEVIQFIARHRLFGLGVGFIDIHLLAAVQLTPGATFWTRDKRLAAVAETLKVAFRI